MTLLQADHLQRRPIGAIERAGELRRFAQLRKSQQYVCACYRKGTTLSVTGSACYPAANARQIGTILEPSNAETPRSCPNPARARHRTAQRAESDATSYSPEAERRRHANLRKHLRLRSITTQFVASHSLMLSQPILVDSTI